MPRVTFIEYDGTQHQVEGDAGLSLMRVAVDNNVPGIDADCGGECACATCHVFLDEGWLAKTGASGEDEERLLGFAAARQDNSRLSCQIEFNDHLDGLVLHLPEAQH